MTTFLTIIFLLCSFIGAAILMVSEARQVGLPLIGIVLFAAGLSGMGFVIPEKAKEDARETLLIKHGCLEYKTKDPKLPEVILVDNYPCTITKENK